MSGGPSRPAIAPHPVKKTHLTAPRTVRVEPIDAIEIDLELLFGEPAYLPGWRW